MARLFPITWTDRAAGKAYYQTEHAPFVDLAVRVLKFNKVIKVEPKSKDMIDLRCF